MTPPVKEAVEIMLTYVMEPVVSLKLDPQHTTNQKLVVFSRTKRLLTSAMEQYVLGRVVNDTEQSFIWEQIQSLMDWDFRECHPDILAEVFPDSDYSSDFQPDDCESATGSTKHGQKPVPEKLLEIASAVHKSASALTDEASDQMWLTECHKLLIEGASGGRILGSDEHWSLPNFVDSSKYSAVRHPGIRDALSIKKVLPAGAIQMPLSDTALKKLFGPFTDSTSFKSNAIAKRTIPFLMESQSPSLVVTTPAFYSTVFSTPAQGPSDFPKDSKESFAVLRRFNRLATTSLLRQLQAYGITNLPIFGVALSKSLVAIHAEWKFVCDGDEVSLIASAFAPLSIDEELESIDSSLDDDIMVNPMKVWDLRKPAEALQVVKILHNMHEFTLKTFAARVAGGILSSRARILKGDFKPWKWDFDRSKGNIEYFRTPMDKNQNVIDGKKPDMVLNIPMPDVDITGLFLIQLHILDDLVKETA
ncbi:hypothetical protein BD410DRAFT_782083 [Rickenella mellea]|uniref:Uncharacterized protein n=1 Tax=Rickenella mellea TaxID=50990 RepID=A0A4Y7QMP2_9AGAM|nr:hypothetical protein BD410DRAFT_782083 [Rickenella mellea]